MLAANHTAWLTRTVLNTDNFVAALAPLPQDEAVSLALAQRVADGVIETFDVTASIAEALPEGIEFGAIPLSNGVRDLIADIAVEVIRSDSFTAVWTAALTGAHRIATAYVGALDDGVLIEKDGVAVLDLTAIVAQISERLGDRGFDLLDGADRELQIELFELPDSGMMKFLVGLMQSVRLVVVLVTARLLILTLGVATDRRRIAVWIGGATMFAMAFSLVDMRYARSALTGGIEDPIRKAGAEAAWDITFRGLIAQTWIAFLIGAAVVFGAWVVGDSDRATSMRAAVSGWRDSENAGVEPSSTTVFLAAHRRLIEWGAAAIVFAFLLIGPPQSFWIVLTAFVILVVVVAGVEVAWASVSQQSTVSETVD